MRRLRLAAGLAAVALAAAACGSSGGGSEQRLGPDHADHLAQLRHRAERHGPAEPGQGVPQGAQEHHGERGQPARVQLFRPAPGGRDLQERPRPGRHVDRPVHAPVQELPGQPEGQGSGVGPGPGRPERAQVDQRRIQRGQRPVRDPAGEPVLHWLLQQDRVQEGRRQRGAHRLEPAVHGVQEAPLGRLHAAGLRQRRPAAGRGVLPLVRPELHDDRLVLGVPVAGPVQREDPVDGDRRTSPSSPSGPSSRAPAAPTPTC